MLLISLFQEKNLKKIQNINTNKYKPNADVNPLPMQWEIVINS
jgi:hypothetical protein